MAGMGIRAAYGMRNTRIRRSTAAWTIPATGLRPPFFMLAAVLAMAPVAGMPPKSADAAFPTPWATSSMLELCFPPIMPSATTQESRDSMAASTAMVMASGITLCTMLKLMDGRRNVGRPEDMVYKSPMVLTFRSRAFTSTAAATTAIKDGGTFLKHPGHRIRMASDTAPTARA